MYTNVYWITDQLGIMPRPRGGDWLDGELENLHHHHGASVLVSTLTPHEMHELDLNEEPRRCETLGMRFITHAIEDRQVPPSMSSYSMLVSELDLLLERSAKIAIHCRQGIGRSNLIAAGVLAHRGARVGEVWELISDARGARVPDTEAQRAWLERWRHVVEFGIRTDRSR